MYTVCYSLPFLRSANGRCNKVGWWDDCAAWPMAFHADFFLYRMVVEISRQAGVRFSTATFVDLRGSELQVVALLWLSYSPPVSPPVPLAVFPLPLGSPLSWSREPRARAVDRPITGGLGTESNPVAAAQPTLPPNFTPSCLHCGRSPPDKLPPRL